MLILNSVRGFDAQLLGQGHLILVIIYSKFISFSWGEKNRKEMNDLERFLNTNYFKQWSCSLDQKRIDMFSIWVEVKLV
jgi:hypothetical protein